MKITAQAPCRVDLAGGTLDIWPLYLFHPGAVTVNFAIDLHTTCVAEARRGRAIRLVSRDLGLDKRYESLAALRAIARHKHTLAAEILRFFTPAAGLDLHTHSEAPAGAGISGSSALIIAVTSALNRLTGTRYPLEKLREISQNLEAQIIGVPTGCQDYYPAMYGGISAIELTAAGIRREAIPVPAAELDRRFVLAYTGAPRNSGINNWEVMKAHINGDKTVYRNFERIAAIARALRQALEKQDWREVSRLLREEWTHRRKNAPGITTPLIDRLVDLARRSGATGAKACGAGGGGCVVFLVEPGAKQRVAETIESAGAVVLPVKVAPKGVRVRIEP
jgi:D-glycero-alpha-D-manno-heptose-7-phosphate kinase